MAESSSAVLINKCTFSGMGQKESYAVYNLASNAVLVDCETSEDKDYFYPFTPAYLPRSGGTMTGNIAFDAGDNVLAYLYPTDDESVVGINGGSSVYKGGILRVYGIDEEEETANPEVQGGVGLGACDGEKLVTTLQVRKDGKAYVNNKEIVCVESWKSGPSWYRKYSDGFIEQQGLVSGYSGNTVAVTFYCAMFDTSYYMGITRVDSGEARYDTRAFNRTKTGATLHLDNNHGENARWYVCGFWKWGE